MLKAIQGFLEITVGSSIKDRNFLDLNQEIKYNQGVIKLTGKLLVLGVGMSRRSINGKNNGN